MATCAHAGARIDLSFVDQQTALVGMVGRMLVKHLIVKTDVSTKINSTFSANFQLNKVLLIISCFVLNKIDKFGYIVTKKKRSFLDLHLWLSIVFQSGLAKTRAVTLQKKGLYRPVRPLVLIYNSMTRNSYRPIICLL